MSFSSILTWLLTLRRQFPALFQPGVGCCLHHMISSFSFKFPLLFKQQPRPVVTGPIEDGAILQELLKLVKLGVIQETTQEPYIIPAFGVPRKNGAILLLLDFGKFNSCIQHQPFLSVNREFSLVGVRPYTIGSALDLTNAY